MTDYKFKFSSAYLEALGRISINASYLESILVKMIHHLIGADRGLGERITADATFRTLANQCRALINYRLADQIRDDALSWLDKAVDAYGLRSRVVHSHWYITALKRRGKSGLMLGLRRSTVRTADFKKTYQVSEPDDLHAIGLQLEQVGLKGEELITEIDQRLQT